MFYQIDPLQTTVLGPEPISDCELMTGIKGGDEGALVELFRRHQPLLRSIVSKVLHVDADVDDAMQDVLHQAWNRSQDYDESKGKPLGWLVTMARRRAIDRIRRVQAYNRAEERMRLETQQVEVMFHTHVEEEAMQSDRAEIILRALGTLPEAQRHAVHLAYYRGLSQREIAAELHIPLGTIKTRLELGMRKLKHALLAMNLEEAALA